MISYQLLGTRDWFVIHHSDCGMQLFTDDIISGLLEKSLQTATIDSSGWHDIGEIFSRCEQRQHRGARAGGVQWQCEHIARPRPRERMARRLLFAGANRDG